MLPMFISNKKVDSNYFFIWDEHSWYKAPGISDDDIVKDGGEFEVPSVDTPLGFDFPPTDMDVEGKAMDADFPKIHAAHGGGAVAPASEVPSPQPSPAYRRF
jgi:hypothetical protein